MAACLADMNGADLLAVPLNVVRLADEDGASHVTEGSGGAAGGVTPARAVRQSWTEPNLHGDVADEMATAAVCRRRACRTYPSTLDCRDQVVTNATSGPRSPASAARSALM